jgi:hypothetical protein
MTAATASHPNQATWALSVDVVQWGIEQLRAQPIHSFFAAYILLRQQSAREATDTVTPNWAEYSRYYKVPGVPGSPIFRPFWDQARNAQQHWIRDHPRGSYNPSSVRAGTAGRHVLGVSADNKSWIFTPDHWKRAKEDLLHGRYVPAIALFVFLYRNDGFQTNGVSPPPHGLIDIFREDFGYQPGADDEEFDYLYDTTVPERTDWFESAPEAPDEE